MQFRMFFQIPDKIFHAMFVMEFIYDEEMDWYEVKMFQGSEIIGYVHGYGNRGWAPQVNNIWVMEKFRRSGIASAMMSKVEAYFGQIPVPGRGSKIMKLPKGSGRNICPAGLRKRKPEPQKQK